MNDISTNKQNKSKEKVIGAGTVVIDHRKLLKDLEPIIKSPDKLYRGREITNFQIKPRESVGLFLLCAVFNVVYKDKWYISTDPADGDGCLCRKAGPKKYYVDFQTEHVFVTKYKETDVNESIRYEINKKESRGTQYGKNRNLIVFIDKSGEIEVEALLQFSKQLINFESYWLIFLNYSDAKGYVYKVVSLKSKEIAPHLFAVAILGDFSDYTLSIIR